MRSFLFVLALACVSMASASAHGGNQRGPNDRTPRELTGPVCGLGVPPGKEPDPPVIYIDETPWDNWWSFNKERFLARPKPPIDEPARGRVVERLRTLIADPSADVAAAALIGFARVESRIGRDTPPDFVQSLAKYVADPRCYEPITHGPSAEQTDVWQSAVLALGIAGGDAAIARLNDLALETEAGRRLAATEDVTDRMRATAAYALGIAGSRASDGAVRRAIVRSLVEVLAERPAVSVEVQVAAVNALGIVPLAFGDDTADAKGAWSSRAAQIRHLSSFYAHTENAYLARAHVPGALASLLDGAPESLRVQVAELLLPALDTNTRERDEVRIGCVIALGRIGDCDADPVDARIRRALLGMAEYGDMLSKNLTNVALAQIATREGSGSDVEKSRAFVRDHLLAQLTKGKGHMRPYAALGLGMLEREHVGTTATEPDAVIRTLRASLQQAETPERIGAYAIALGIARDRGAESLLRVELAEESTPYARGFVALSLGLIGARDALGDVRSRIAESKYAPDLMTRAVIGFGLLGGERDVLELCKLLDHAKGRSTVGAIATAIGLTGDARAIDPLIALTTRKDVTDSARAFAASALGMLADERALPWNECLSANVNYRAGTSVLSTFDGRGALDFL